MTKRRIVLISGVILLFAQVILFKDYISPIHWGQIKVSGLACTCPDEKVISGKLYLRKITPDSLRKYNLNYSEIFVTEIPSTDTDPMGVDLYIIKGKVIGKDRVSKNAPWHPKILVKEWREVNILKDWLIKILFFGQLIIFVILLNKIKSKSDNIRNKNLHTCRNER